MSHFLARLVQRTRGETSTVRPVLPAVTAPDPTAAAWDEQLVVREAAPLVAPQIARSDPGGPSWPEATRAEPAAAREILGDELPRSVPMHASMPTASVLHPALAESRAELDARRDAFRTSAELAAPSSLPQAASPGAPAWSPASPTAWPGTPGTSRAAPASRAAPTTLQTTSIRTTADPARDAAATRVPPSAASPAGAADVAPAPIATHIASAIARMAGGETARAAMPVDLPGRPDARESNSIAATGAARLGGPPRRVGPAYGPISPPALADAAARRSAPRPGLASHGAPEAQFQEAATTVEVSIGRIEVRLPPRPPTSAGAAPSTRRPVIGLADYLRARDTGKPP
jgi:hypothetical protein